MALHIHTQHHNTIQHHVTTAPNNQHGGIELESRAYCEHKGLHRREGTRKSPPRYNKQPDLWCYYLAHRNAIDKLSDTWNYLGLATTPKTSSHADENQTAEVTLNPPSGAGQAPGRLKDACRTSTERPAIAISTPALLRRGLRYRGLPGVRPSAQDKHLNTWNSLEHASTCRTSTQTPGIT